MRLRNLFFTVLCASAFIALASCERIAFKAIEFAKEQVNKEVNSFDYTDSEKWGPVVTRSLVIDSFANITTMGAVQIQFTQDSVCTLVVEGNEKAIDEYIIEVENGELDVRHKSGKGKVDKNTPRLTLHLTAPSLSEIYVEGAGDLNLTGDIVQPTPMSVNISGAGDLDIDYLTCGGFDVQIKGAGDADIKQLTCNGDVEMEVSGVGDIEANVKCTDLTLRVNGAGDATLDVNCEYLRTYINGAGNLTLKGECYKFINKSGQGSNLNTDELEVNG